MFRTWNFRDSLVNLINFFLFYLPFDMTLVLDLPNSTVKTGLTTYLSYNRVSFKVEKFLIVQLRFQIFLYITWMKCFLEYDGLKLWMIFRYYWFCHPITTIHIGMPSSFVLSQVSCVILPVNQRLVTRFR